MLKQPLLVCPIRVIEDEEHLFLLGLWIPQTRFDKHFSRLVLADSGCLEWTGAKNSAGYGNIGYFGKNILAHRMFYEAFVGKIQEGLILGHECDNPACCKPEHLFAGTYLDNTHDMLSKRGHAQPHLKITIDMKNQMIELTAQGLTQKDISKILKVSQTTISRHLRNEVRLKSEKEEA